MLGRRGFPVSVIPMLVVIGLLTGAAPVWSQTPFTLALPWWTATNGTVGVSTDGVTLSYDLDGNGSVIDPWVTVSQDGWPIAQPIVDVLVPVDVPDSGTLRSGRVDGEVFSPGAVV